MDIGETIAPRSDQLNYDDLIPGDMTVTIAEVRKGTTEQPVEIHLAETPGRPYKPSKSMRRVLVNAWGRDAQAYVGRRMVLYGDPSVKWAGKPVGGIRIRALSDLDGSKTTELTVARGAPRERFTVQPMPDATPAVPMISRGQWENIATAAANSGITEPLAWAADQVGRSLDGPQQITAEEAAMLMGNLEERSQ